MGSDIHKEHEMTRDEILAMLREAASQTVDYDLRGNLITDADVVLMVVLRFAELVRKQALEDAAKVCERGVETIWEYHSAGVKEACGNVCTNLTASIRSLKERV